MRILVTGHKGYIGSVTTAVLRQAGFEVVGLDCELYRGCDFGRVRENAPAFHADIRDVSFADLLSFDAVVHLAGLADDAAGDLDAALTRRINVDATLCLAQQCRQAGVGRFVFASSCSVYGHGGAGLLDENAPARPLSVYAQSKLTAERALSDLTDGAFHPLFLRLGTVYGVSPRMRLDTVANDFVGSAVSRGRIDMQTMGASWRPFVHVEDVARGVAASLTAPQQAVSNQIFNVAPPDGNWRVIDLADLVCELVPGCVRRAHADRVDLRSYRVSGAKLLEALPGFSYRWNLRSGIQQLRTALEHGGLTPSEWRGHRYRRAARLAHLLETGIVDALLRGVVETAA